MPRKTRKELLVEDEDLTRDGREEAYRRLEIQLRQAWRTAIEKHSSTGAR